MKIKFEWETIIPYTFRAKVIGGWILSEGNGHSPVLVFIPDPEHKWEIE